jgi:FkbM family methyltransferase
MIKTGHFAGIDSSDYYEPERCLSMEKNLKQGDTLFDLGVSDGWLSAVYAQFVGAENLCLFEPSPDAWPNIKAIWEENKLSTPRSTFCGFVSDKTNLTPTIPDHDLNQRDGWPLPAYSDNLLGDDGEMRFRSVKERAHDTPQTTLDDFVARTGIIPHALSVDVEGAETLVLRGAEYVLRELKVPLVWLSLHTINGALSYDYNSSKEEVLGIMTSYGYDGTWLADEGDAHWFFTRK